MFASRRWSALLLAALLAGAAPAAAEKGTGIMTQLDPILRTVTIHGEVYRVDADTRIEDTEGFPLTFSQLPDPAASTKVPFYEFESVSAAGGPLLVHLRVRPAPR